MDSTTNEINSIPTLASTKVTIFSVNSTPSADVVMQSHTPSISEHIEVTNIRNMNDCLLRLSDGDGEFPTKAMPCLVA